MRHLILGNGGFTELSMHGRWRINERGYVAALRRYATEIGNLAWAAPMDHMTEQHILARTGATVRVHQHRTVVNYLRLCDLAPELPIIPVLQGQSIADYNRCADFYERHGVDLAALPLVGVGSVCRRQHTAEVEQIMRSLAARGYRLHAFGAKVQGLARYADAISSSDSASWSLRGRYVPGCSPTHRSESNCLPFAMAWHARLLRSLRIDEPGTQSDCVPTSTHANGSRARAEKAKRTRPDSACAAPAAGRRPAHRTRPGHSPPSRNGDCHALEHRRTR